MAHEKEKAIEKEQGTNTPSSVLPDELSDADVEQVAGSAAKPCPPTYPEEACV